MTQIVPETEIDPETQLVPPRYVVRGYRWSERENIPVGWEPFAFDSSDAMIICRKWVDASEDTP